MAQLLPAVLSLIVLAAHFLRAGKPVLAAAILGLVALLAVRRRWVVRLAQTVLLLGAAEWIRTLMLLVARRIQAGEPAVRLSIILGSVALLTALSAFVFRTARLRARYGGGRAPAADAHPPPAPEPRGPSPAGPAA